MPSLTKIARRAVARPAIGTPIARTLHLVRAEHAARKVAVLNGRAAPAVVDIELPSGFATPTLRMDTNAGREQIALRAWTHGWADFEPPLPQFFTACIGAGAVVLDVGANTGFYALLAASTATGVAVHAFEPLPTAARHFERNLALNPQGAAVTVVEQAVDAETGEIDLLVPPGDALATSASLEPDFQPVWGERVRVERTTVDAYAAHMARVDVLKVDVEGAEPRVLEGARETLERCRPVVFFEAINHGDVWRADCARIERLREQIGYASVVLLEDRAAIRPAVAHEPGCENQALWPLERIEKLGELCRRLHAPLADER